MLDLSSVETRKRLSQPASDGFFAIMDRWQVPIERAGELLGGMPRSTVYKSRSASGTLRQDELTRISYIVGIYKALHILLPDEQADRWITQPNDNAMPGVHKITYPHDQRGQINCHAYAVELDRAIHTGAMVADTCRALRDQGFRHAEVLEQGDDIGKCLMEGQDVDICGLLIAAVQAVQAGPGQLSRPDLVHGRAVGRPPAVRERGRVDAGPLLRGQRRDVPDDAAAPVHHRAEHVEQQRLHRLHGGTSPALAAPGGHGSTTIFPVPVTGPKASDGKNGSVRAPGPDVRSWHERDGGAQGTHHYRAGQRELGLGGG